MKEHQQQQRLKKERQHQLVDILRIVCVCVVCVLVHDAHSFKVNLIFNLI